MMQVGLGARWPGARQRGGMRRHFTPPAAPLSRRAGAGASLTCPAPPALRPAVRSLPREQCGDLLVLPIYAALPPEMQVRAWWRSRRSRRAACPASG